MCVNSVFQDKNDNPILPMKNQSIAQDDEQFNNTGKFVLSGRKQEDVEIEGILRQFDTVVSNSSKCANSSFYEDELIQTMQEDEESSKFVTQRLQEILSDKLAAERESTILELTKQVGALEVQHQMAKRRNSSEIESKANSSQLHFSAKFEAQESEIVKLKHEIDLKEQEISFLKNSTSVSFENSRIQQQYHNLNIEYKVKYEEMIKENIKLNSQILALTNEINTKDSTLAKFEARERDLRSDIIDLKEKVSSIKEIQSQTMANNSWTTENAIQMFNERLKQLEKDKANISDDEHHLPKTPDVTKPDEQKVYLNKLKNTLKVYKQRSREFEKRSIELECVNCALQKEIVELKSKISKSSDHTKEAKKMQDKHNEEIKLLQTESKAKIKAKKDKYMAKLKELEAKFMQMCEQQIEAIDAKAIQDELEQYKQKVDDEYIHLKEHEKIVNEIIKELKQTHTNELQAVCDQFENEFVRGQEEFEQEKEQLTSDFNDQISQIHELADSRSQDVQIAVQETECYKRQLEQLKQELNEVLQEKTRLQDEINSFRENKEGEKTEQQEAICRLNKELNNKQGEIHRLATDNEKVKKQLADQEKSAKYSINTLEKKLKQVTSESESKLKHKVAENVDLTQNLLQLQSQLAQKEEECSHLSVECDSLHDSNVKLSNDLSESSDYIQILEAKLKMFNSKRKAIVGTLLSNVHSKLSQFKQELEFYKKCQKDEMGILQRQMESSINEIATYCRNVVQTIKNRYEKECNSFKEELESDWRRKMNLSERQYREKIEEQNERIDYLSEELDQLQNEYKDVRGRQSKTEIELEKLSQEKHTVEQELDCYEQAFDDYFSESMTKLTNDFEKQRQFQDTEITRKIQILKDAYKQHTQELETKIQNMQTAHTKEKSDLESKHQSKIDEIFKESRGHYSNLKNVESQLEIVSQKVELAKLESGRYKEMIQNLLQNSNIEINSDFSIEKGVNDLMLKMRESEQTISRLQNEYSTKSKELKKLNDKNKMLEKHCKAQYTKMTQELCKSKEELKFKEIQLEKNKEIIDQSRELLDKKRRVNDHNAKSLHKLLSKLEVRQNERSIERDNTSAYKSRISPTRSQSTIALVDQIQKTLDYSQNNYKTFSRSSSMLDSHPVEPIGVENNTKMDIEEL